MIQVNELRLKNWVLNIYDSPVQVTVIDDTIDWSKPIPLTPEILGKCDLGKQNEYPYRFHYGYLKMRNGTFFYKYFDIEIELPYLHKLQNLYYALTGEELIYKP